MKSNNHQTLPVQFTNDKPISSVTSRPSSMHFHTHVTQFIRRTLNKRFLSKLVPIISTGILATTLSACNSIPQEQQTNIIAQPNIPLDQSYPTNDKKTVSTSTYPSIAVQRWQKFYSDAKLKRLIELALQNNKDLENALLAIKKSKAQYQISEKALIPSLNGGASLSRGAKLHALDKNSSASYNVNLAMASYELDLWGRIASLKEQALQNYLVSTAGKDSVQIALIANVAQVYVNLSYAQSQHNLAKKTVESRKKSLFIAKRRFEVGVDPKSPSLQAAASLENAKLELYATETNIMKLTNALELLIGMPLPKELMPKAGITAITHKKVLSAGLPSELLRYRPDILQAEYNLKAAGANLEVARTAYFPSIRLTGNLGLSSAKLSDLFKGSAFGWSFGPSVSVPIFDAGQLDANYEMAKISQQQALTAYEKSIQTAFKEVSDVLADRSNMEAMIASQYKLQDNFHETYIIANARYKSGLSDYLAVLDAERSLFNTQKSILNQEQAKIMSQVQLYQALGGGVAMDVPVELSMPNQRDLVTFIKGNVTNQDALNDNTSVTTTNVVRGSSTSRLATPTDFKHTDATDTNTSKSPVVNTNLFPSYTVNSFENAKQTALTFIRMVRKDVNKITNNITPSNKATQKPFIPEQPKNSISGLSDIFNTDIEENKDKNTP